MTRSNKKTPATPWHEQRPVLLASWVLAWGVAYFMLLAALNSAHNLEYLACFVAFIFGLNRLVRGIRGR